MKNMNNEMDIGFSRGTSIRFVGWIRVLGVQSTSRCLGLECGCEVGLRSSALHSCWVSSKGPTTQTQARRYKP